MKLSSRSDKGVVADSKITITKQEREEAKNELWTDVYQASTIADLVGNHGVID